MIVIGRDIGWYAWLDVLILLLIMEFAMYVLHRVVHLPWFYPIHHLHHRYERPRPLDLFVLHPLENLSLISSSNDKPERAEPSGKSTLTEPGISLPTSHSQSQSADSARTQPSRQMSVP